MPGSSLSSTTEPNWRGVSRFSNRSLPPATRGWLLDDGSLTRRLIASHQGEFKVHRLRQVWATPRPSERDLLATPARQRALVREVVLSVGGRPLVFARSLFPVSSLTGRLRHLRHLRERSLGAILFRYPEMRRSPFELARLPGNSPYLPQDLWQDEAAWARRSCFDIAGQRLLVSEVFLREFRPWSAVLPLHRSGRGKVSAAILDAKQ